jgi:hypothetical protein
VTGRETISRRWIVLNDHERKTLREVERQCMAEDPDFTRGFEARQARLSRHPHRLGVGIGLVAAAILAVFLLIVGLLGSALVVAAVTGVIIWAVRYHWVGTDRPTP